MKVSRLLLVGGALGSACALVNRFSQQRKAVLLKRKQELETARWEDEGGTPAATPSDLPDPAHVARPSEGA